MKTKWMGIIFYFELMILACNSIKRVENIDYENLPAPSELFENILVLAKPSEYILYWSYNDTSIRFEVHVKTSGWFAFGLSPNGHLFNSDLVYGWINNDLTGHFSGNQIFKPIFN